MAIGNNFNLDSGGSITCGLGRNIFLRRSTEAPRNIEGVGSDIASEDGPPITQRTSGLGLYGFPKDLTATTEAHPTSAPLFIVNPLSGRGMDNLFNRIAALEKLSREMGLDSFGAGAPAGDSRSPGPWG